MNYPPHLRPLGTPQDSRPARALFVDRWGTLLLPSPPATITGKVGAKKGWCANFSDIRFVPGGLDALFRAGQQGWTIYLIGNEDAVAGGRWGNASWGRFEEDLMTHLAKQGIAVRRNYACLDRPGGKGAHDRESVFRLPGTGIFYHAAQMDGVDLSESWVIGDGPLELVAGWRAGCRLAAIRAENSAGAPFSDGTFHHENLRVTPDHVLLDLPSALGIALAAPPTPHRHPA
jgi:histidinol phosphatase-like enzyme